jgi:protein-S-isoprenylcysteine O-methyltransferase Ste14
MAAPSRFSTRQERLGGRVPFPPPLIYALVTLLAWLVHRRWPMALLNDAGAARAVGIGAAVAAVTLFFLSAREFRRARTMVRPDRESVAIVRSRIFRYSRNPIYIAMAILQVAIGFWVNSVWIVGAVLISLLAISRVITGEERYLEAKFGEPYRAYLRSQCAAGFECRAS